MRRPILGGLSNFWLVKYIGPIYRISNGTADRLGSENVEIWFPISPRYCLVLHALKNSPNSIITWPQRKVREVNEFIARESLEVGSHSNKLLRSVLAIRQ